MFYALAKFVILVNAFVFSNSQICRKECPLNTEKMICGFNAQNSSYQMFPSKCALLRFKECYGADINETPLKFCIKAQESSARKMYGESCPVFCPSHYRPVCGANTLLAYRFRTFVNACQFDMLNCRGDDVFSTYTQVPLSYCQDHLMKNIFQEKMVMTNIKEYHDYNE